MSSSTSASTSTNSSPPNSTSDLLTPTTPTAASYPPPRLPTPTPQLRSVLKHRDTSASAGSGLGAASFPTSPLPSGSRPITPPAFSSASASPSLKPELLRGNSGNGNHNHHESGSTTGYLSKVSFDTFENPSEQAMFSYTLQVKSEHYTRNSQTRVFLCAASADESGSNCLDWAMESLVQDSDELVVLRGFDSYELATNTQQDAVRQEAKDLMSKIQRQNDPTSRQLSIIVEFVAGRVTQNIERLIALYRPDALIVGSRGSSGTALSNINLKSWTPFGSKVGSVSKWCLSHSPVPVIVVRPERKVRKSVEKRRADPKRMTGDLFERKPEHPGTGVLPKSISLQ